MSNLKDIMSVDVEPLESQAAYRRAASQHQATQPTVDQRSATPSPPLDENNKGKAPIKRRRSDRVPKASSNTSTPGPNIVRRRSSAAAGEAMDFNSGYQAGMRVGVGGSSQASTSGSPQQSSRGSEQPSSESFPVKYTPVTGRISRAKKGVPVHTCDVCRPVKTFTRAEHLRRHQLSHQKPAYPCTFQDCERAFHRPDLLARHLHRHETQGEKAYKSTGPRSRRASSSASEGRTPPLKVETPSQNAATNQTSPTNSLTPRTSGSAEGSMTAFSAITSSFSAVNFSPVAGGSHKRSASEAQLSGAGPYSPASLSSGTTARPPTSFGITSSPFQSNNETNLANGDHFARASEQNFGGMYFETNSPSFQNFGSSHSLPLLRIPEETYVPGLSHTQDNSPFCSSASDSTYSTQSEGSRNGRLWAMRGRAHSLTTTADWSAPIGASQWSPHPMSTTPQDIRSPPSFDSMLEHYETPYSSPRMTPPNTTRQLLDVPNTFGGYYMESVGTPALPTYNKPMAQIFSASPTRISDSGLASIDGRKDMVEPQSLGSLGTLSLSSPASYQQLAQLDGYISSYWQSFDHLFPIIHRGTFDSSEDRLLSSAMAAMGTQYHDSPEARQRGIELNDYCRKSIGMCPNWNTATMQAILLTEIFTRFRGRKTNIETSHHFTELYSRLLNNSSRDQTPFSTHSSNVASGDSLLDPFSPHQTTQQSGLHTDWTQWADTQARQRLLAACFMFDVHQSIYHEQRRSDIHLEETASMLCLPCQDDIWIAPTAVEWQAKSADSTVQHLPLIEQDISSHYVISQSPFAQCLYICSLASRLPPREDPTYPSNFFPHSIDSTVMSLRSQFPTSPLAHSYLALHHTPLHDLLAIAGDTWVFGKKITPPSAFHSAQSRLKVWAASLAAAAATQHACHMITTVLQPQSQELSCVSDYWALYTAALICWAFGHRYQSSSSGQNGTLSASNPSATVDNSMDIDSPLASSADEAKLKAITYVNGMLELDTEDLLTSKASMRGDTVGVIDAVRSRLEVDGVGGKCMMIVDAILVLTRIKEGGRGKWF